MKYVCFLVDGMADEPIPELNHKTPLMAANTPNMNRLTRQSVQGMLLTLPEPFPTSSDVANLSVLGYDLAASYCGRGPIEAISTGFPLQPDDIAFRLNLISTEKDILTDYSAGQISSDLGKSIIAALNERLGDKKIIFYPGVSYRNILVLRGQEFSTRVAYHKPDSSHGRNINDIYPEAEAPEADVTVQVLSRIMNESKDVLRQFHKTGSKASMVWPWSPGKKPHLTSFWDKYHKTAAVISAVDVIKGIGLLAGMDVIKVPGVTGYLDTNFEGKGLHAFNCLKDHDFVYCHLEAVDETSHLGNLADKIRAIEYFDERLLGTFLKNAEAAHLLSDLVIGILPDHPVPIKLRAHTREPVPFMIYNHEKSDNFAEYNEDTGKTGSLGLLKADEFMRAMFELK
ncbi:MAG: cofactor-independent phosphoglycerate mutase [Acidobacteria bacterium]|nr:cofactor-independent phosphoglycerate mutase [Acidobacteriota bacterium]